MSPREMPSEDVWRTQSRQFLTKIAQMEDGLTAALFRHDYPFEEDRSIHRLEVVQLTTNFGA